VSHHIASNIVLLLPFTYVLLPSYSCACVLSVGAVVLPLDPKEVRKGKASAPYLLALVSIGDCKLFHYSVTEGRIRDVTRGNRQDVDPCDPGGRLGPYMEAVKGGEHVLPDMRNLMFGHIYLKYVCHLLFCVSFLFP
jgi:hypothetical protein